MVGGWGVGGLRAVGGSMVGGWGVGGFPSVAKSPVAADGEVVVVTAALLPVDVVAVPLDVVLGGDVVAVPLGEDVVGNSSLVDEDVDVEVDVGEADVEAGAGVSARPGGATVGTVSPGAIARTGGGGAFGSAGPFETFASVNAFTGAGAGFTTTAFLALKSFQESPTKFCLTAAVAAIGSDSGLPHAQRTRGTPTLSTSTAVPFCSTD